ncbi:alpha/beta-hydrolase [Hymenopellis radicata]|nr:alpha/beta-hydrolase [Hymenopellis radicata]
MTGYDSPTYQMAVAMRNTGALDGASLIWNRTFVMNVNHMLNKCTVTYQRTAVVTIWRVDNGGLLGIVGNRTLCLKAQSSMAGRLPSKMATTLPTSPALKIDEFIVENASGLRASVKRYRPDTSITPSHTGYIWLFAHGIGSHKEQWEVTIRRLFLHSSRCVEAWSLDAHNHGSSAALNTRIIEADGFEYVAMENAEALFAIYKQHIAPTQGKKRVIIVGHSAGAAAAALTSMFFKPGTYPFAAVGLVDPGIWPESVIGEETPTYKMAAKSIPFRKASWASRSEAKKYLSSRPPWSGWDKRVLDIYAKDGLKDEASGVVTLKCSPKQEAAIYENSLVDRNGTSAIPALKKLLGQDKAPVHLFYGERSDFFPRIKQDALTEMFRFTSVSRIPGGGHLIVQEAPDAVGDVLFRIIASLEKRTKL